MKVFKPTTFYIFRHGQTFETKYKVDYGENLKTSKIIPEGIPVIKKIAKYLRKINSDYNVSSEFLRCKETVKIIEEITKKKFVYDERLNDELVTPKDDSLEKFSDLKTRVKSFLKEVEDKKYTRIIICTHAGIIICLRYLILTGNLNINNLTHCPDPEPGVLVIIESKNIHELNFNK